MCVCTEVVHCTCVCGLRWSIVRVCIGNRNTHLPIYHIVVCTVWCVFSCIQLASCLYILYGGIVAGTYSDLTHVFSSFQKYLLQIMP